MALVEAAREEQCSPSRLPDEQSKLALQLVGLQAQVTRRHCHCGHSTVEMVNALLSATLGSGNMKILWLVSRRLSLVGSSCRESLLVCCFAVRIGTIKS